MKDKKVLITIIIIILIGVSVFWGYNYYLKKQVSFKEESVRGEIISKESIIERELPVKESEKESEEDVTEEQKKAGQSISPEKEPEQKKEVSDKETIKESKEMTDKEEETAQEVCLTDSEVASYIIERENTSRKGIIKISVKDKDTSQEIYNFATDTPSYNLGHPIELHKCGIYVIRAPVYDYEKDKLPPGSAMEIWRYQYNGNGNKILVLADRDKSGRASLHYNYAFRIDPNEKYNVLIKGYLSKEDYSLVIKNLKTIEDVFVLSMKTIAEEHPNIVGYWDLREWTKGGQYFWVSISESGYIKVFIRIKADTWQYEIFPKSVMGGDAFNPNTGYVTSHSYSESSQGIEAFLSLHNLLTKKEILINTAIIPSESISDWGPPYFFKPKWISDTELEYELPSGEKKVYKINK